MTPSATLSDDLKLVIDFDQLLQSITPEARAALVRSACFESDFIKMVVGVLANGVTEDSWWFGNDTMNEMRLALQPRMDDVVRQTIGILLRQKEQVQLERERYSNWAWAMYHAWGKERPELPEFVCAGRATDEAIAEAMATPSLLEALEHIDTVFVDDLGTDADSPLGKAILAARAAIATATGAA